MELGRPFLGCQYTNGSFLKHVLPPKPSPSTTWARLSIPATPPVSKWALGPITVMSIRETSLWLTLNKRKLKRLSYFVATLASFIFSPAPLSSRRLQISASPRNIYGNARRGGKRDFYLSSAFTNKKK